VVLLFASAAITSNLGVFAIIGGFVIGVAVHDDRHFVEEWKRRVSPIVGKDLGLRPTDIFSMLVIMAL
jgi:Kef-type K+ transport system membrane component KefB